MVDFLQKQFSSFFDWSNIEQRWHYLIAVTVSIILFILITAVIAKLCKIIMYKIVSGFVKRSKTKWDDYIFQKPLLDRSVYFLASVFVYLLIPFFLPLKSFAVIFLQRAVSAFSVLVFSHIVAAFFDGVNAVYQYSAGEKSKRKPIKGYLQLLKVFIYIMAAIIAITTLMNKSPLGILGGLGAMSAVLLLVFKDSIMGFVSSVQLSGNDMVRIGDWIEMPKYNINGTVIDITLQSVVIKNWDAAITTLPIYNLVSDSFVNCRNMDETSRRGLKRSIIIDIQSIHFLSDNEISRLSKLSLLSQYIKDRLIEINTYNKAHNVTTDDISSHRITNTELFCEYATLYLNTLDGIDKNMRCAAHQLQSDKNGLPIELYFYVTSNTWEVYERLLAQIFNHLFSVVNEFGLSVYQNPTGNDIRFAGNSK